MGENEPLAAASPPPSGLFPNGLKPGKVASVTQLLDPERCAKAEDRTAQLIACIQPDPPSEDRRNAVARYVRRLITECFPRQVEVFTFGSVPLKTYLPDGDIDLTAFSRNHDVKDSWAHLVRDVLEKEEKNENAEFRVKEVQYIQAEVKIIKCLVENIVVDISFNQIGGLCTLCFLEEVDNYINQNHLFKRSIILIKAWCYYESRILGAHHGLISTYALETLVLYIFHVFNNSFSGPLEVLYRFLEFFSKFDWDNFCVSLWGPVPISSLPDITAEPPRKDVGELQVSEAFLKACSRVYAVYPIVQDIQGQPFVSKHFNVIDPLRENNNLGRSVSKGTHLGYKRLAVPKVVVNYTFTVQHQSVIQIRSAFSLGAKKLAKLFESSKLDVNHELNNFFKNTWERHGGGHRPDAPGSDLRLLRLSDPEPQHRVEDACNSSGSKINANSSCHQFHRGGVRGTHNEPSRQNIYQAETMSRVTPQNQKISGDVNSSSISYQPAVEIDSRSVSNDKLQRNLKPETVVNNFQGRHLFARTRSSPELTESYGEVPLQSRVFRAQEAGRGQTESEKVDDTKNGESETLSSHVRTLAESSSDRQIPSPRSVASTADANIAVTSYQNDLASGSVNGDFSVGGAHRMGQEEQDLVNSMSSIVGHGFNGRFPFPLNFATGHLPFSIAPSILASMRYGQRNVPEIIPSNPSFTASAWAANADFQQNLVTPFAHHFPGGLPLNPEITGEASNNDKALAEMNLGEPGQDFLSDQERGTHRSALENGDYGTHHVIDKQQSSSDDNSFGPSDQRIRLRDENLDSSYYPVRGSSQMQIDDRTVGSISVSGGSPFRSKTSSESSWDGSTARGSKLVREKRNRKVVSSGHTSALSGKGKGVPEHSIEIDDDNREWIPNSSSEVAERYMSPQSTVATLQVPRRQIHGLEPGQTNGSESIVPLAPFLVGHGMQQRGVDNSGYTFYPTGPPVPFVTMWPMHNFQAGTATSDASPSHLSVDEGVENNEPCKSYASFRVHNQSEILTSSQPSRIASSVDSVEHKPDILNGDFVSHWQNLQYGRSCQTSHPPVMYPTPVVVPPAYFQGRLPWDGPERPFAYPNIVNQLMTYGPQIVPVAPPVQSVSTRPPNIYPRSGTGTYFPTPKISPRERHSSGMRRGNYGHDRNEHNSDRESNWNGGAKTRGSGRGHNRNQREKSSPRQDRSDRQWVSTYRQESTSYSHHSQNGPNRPTSSHDGAANMGYDMYRLPGIKQNSATSEGHNIPSIMMVFPYEHNSDHNPTAEQLEFGSFGPHLNDGSLSPLGAASSVHHLSSSSPDQPSSPHLPRGKW